MRGLTNKSFLITGCSSTLSIGFGAAQRLLEENASRVIITARKQSDLDVVIPALIACIPADRKDITHVDGVLMDLMDKTSIDECLAQVQGILGSDNKLHGVFNNAGMLRPAPGPEISYEDADAEMRTNLLGTIWLTRQVVAKKIICWETGSIVMCSSAGATVPLPTTGIYAATKAGLEQFIKVFAVDLKNQNVAKMDAYKAKLKEYQQQVQTYNDTTTTTTTTSDDINSNIIITSPEHHNNNNNNTNTVVIGADMPEQPELCKIRINCVSPGPVLTSVFDKMGFVDEKAKQDWIEITGQRTVLNRVGNIHEIGATVAFLFSTDAGFITMTSIYADGGLM